MVTFWGFIQWKITHGSNYDKMKFYSLHLIIIQKWNMEVSKMVRKATLWFISLFSLHLFCKNCFVFCWPRHIKLNTYRLYQSINVLIFRMQRMVFKTIVYGNKTSQRIKFVLCFWNIVKLYNFYSLETIKFPFNFLLSFFLKSKDLE